MINKDILKQLVEAYSPSGEEENVKTVVSKYLDDITDISKEDRLGNKVWFINGDGENLPNLAFIAHGDEVGFIVEKITENGFLQVIELGGWNKATISSQLMKVKTDKDWIDGVTTAAAPHLLKNGTTEDGAIFVDIGAKNIEDVKKLGVEVGNPIVPTQSFVELANDRIVAKAFDNRVGVYMLIDIAKKIKESSAKFPFNIQLAVTVQEEVGLRGAKVYNETFKPDYAIIVEGPPADDTPEIKGSLNQGKLGAGPQIRTYDRTMIPSKKLVNTLKEAGKNLSIDYQLSVRKTGGTDGAEIHLSGEGVPSIVYSIPVRGAHSPHSVIDMNDLEKSTELLFEFLKIFSN